MTFRVTVLRAVGAVLLGWLIAGTTLAQDLEVEQDSGTVEALDWAQGTMIVDGREYWTGPDLHVEINGSYGAFTMLEEGMYIDMEYRLRPGHQRELFRITEVLDAAAREES